MMDLELAAEVTRFWTFVDRRGDGECWPWLGYSEGGYGKFPWDGKMTGAHELALAMTIGESKPLRMDTCHSCHNTFCCNPAHLRFDTRESKPEVPQ